MLIVKRGNPDRWSPAYSEENVVSTVKNASHLETRPSRARHVSTSPSPTWSNGRGNVIDFFFKRRDSVARVLCSLRAAVGSGWKCHVRFANLRIYKSMKESWQPASPTQRECVFLPSTFARVFWSVWTVGSQNSWFPRANCTHSGKERPRPIPKAFVENSPLQTATLDMPSWRPKWPSLAKPSGSVEIG